MIFIMKPFRQVRWLDLAQAGAVYGFHVEASMTAQ
jgi:hypothetical protein